MLCPPSLLRANHLVRRPLPDTNKYDPSMGGQIGNFRKTTQRPSFPLDTQQHTFTQKIQHDEHSLARSLHVRLIHPEIYTTF